MKVALYARVSTDDKNQNPDTQLFALREFCERANFEITKEYIDKTRAKDFAHRFSWSQLLKDARQRKFQAVLVFKLDRAFRTVRECCNQVMDWDERGIKFVSSSQDIDTTTAMGRYFLHNLAAVAELESSLISDRVKAGISRRLAEGKRFGRKPLNITSQIIYDTLKQCDNNRSRAAKILGCSRPYINKIIGAKEC